MIFTILFFVEGDEVAGDLKISQKLECETIDELVDRTWGEYKTAIRYIYKRLEADIRCQPRPHESFSISAWCDDVEMDEDEVLEAFFKKRMKEFDENHPYWK
jgi:hypothetical protein